MFVCIKLAGGVTNMVYDVIYITNMIQDNTFPIKQRIILYIIEVCIYNTNHKIVVHSNTNRY